MKKFMKVCAIAALICIVVGLILGVTGWQIRDTSSVSLGEALSAVTGGRIGSSDVHYELDDNIKFNEDYAIREGSVEKYALGDRNQGIRELAINVGACQMTIAESEDDSFWVEAVGMRRFQGYVDGGMLEISGTSKAFSNSENWAGSITLYVPEGYTWEAANLELGAGRLTVETLQTGTISANVDAGQMIFEQLTADEADLECGMGQLIVHELNSRSVDANVSMGDLQLTGDVTESITGECGMGSLTLQIAGSQSDFNYDLECGMGELRIGDDTYSGLANEKQINNNAAKTMDLKCSMGSVTVEFK